MDKRLIVHKPGAAGRKQNKQKGFTLIESGIVIGLFSLIIIAMLVALDYVMKQRRLNQVITDIAVIRSSVTMWTGGRPLFYTGNSVRRGNSTVIIPDPRTLRHWSQLSYFLQEPMAMRARGEQSNTLPAANPWDGSYILDFPTSATVNPRQWDLTVTNVPYSASTVLVNHVLQTGIGVAQAQQLDGSPIPPTGGNDLPIGPSTAARIIGINEPLVQVVFGFRE